MASFKPIGVIRSKGKTVLNPVTTDETASEQERAAIRARFSNTALPSLEALTPRREELISTLRGRVNEGYGLTDEDWGPPELPGDTGLVGSTARMGGFTPLGVIRSKQPAGTGTYGTVLKASALEVVQGLTAAAAALTNGQVGADATASLRDDIAAAYQSLDPHIQEDLQREFTDLGPEGVLRNPTSIGWQLLKQVPILASLLIPGGVGGVAGRAIGTRLAAGAGALARQQAARTGITVGAAAAGALGEGSVVGGMTAADIINGIETAPEADLMRHPRYAQYRNTMDEGPARERFLKDVGYEIARVRGTKAGAGSALLSLLPGIVYGRALAGTGARGLRGVKHGVVAESIQEAGQESFEQYQTGLGARETYDPTRDPTAGLGEAAVAGGVLGGLMGGGITGVGAIGRWALGVDRIDDQDRTTQQTGGEAENAALQAEAARGPSQQDMFQPEVGPPTPPPGGGGALPMPGGAVGPMTEVIGAAPAPEPTPVQEQGDLFTGEVGRVAGVESALVKAKDELKAHKQKKPKKARKGESKAGFNSRVAAWEIQLNKLNNEVTRLQKELAASPEEVTAAKQPTAVRRPTQELEQKGPKPPKLELEMTGEPTTRATQTYEKARELYTKLRKKYRKDTTAPQQTAINVARRKMERAYAAMQKEQGIEPMPMPEPTQEVAPEQEDLFPQGISPDVRKVWTSATNQQTRRKAVEDSLKAQFYQQSERELNENELQLVSTALKGTERRKGKSRKDWHRGQVKDALRKLARTLSLFDPEVVKTIDLTSLSNAIRQTYKDITGETMPETKEALIRTKADLVEALGTDRTPAKVKEVAADLDLDSDAIVQVMEEGIEALAAVRDEQITAEEEAEERALSEEKGEEIVEPEPEPKEFRELTEREQAEQPEADIEEETEEEAEAAAVSATEDVARGAEEAVTDLTEATDLTEKAAKAVKKMTDKQRSGIVRVLAKMFRPGGIFGGLTNLYRTGVTGRKGMFRYKLHPSDSDVAPGEVLRAFYGAMAMFGIVHNRPAMQDVAAGGVSPETQLFNALVEVFTAPQRVKFLAADSVTQLRMLAKKTEQLMRKVDLLAIGETMNDLDILDSYTDEDLRNMGSENLKAFARSIIHAATIRPNGVAQNVAKVEDWIKGLRQYADSIRVMRAMFSEQVDLDVLNTKATKSALDHQFSKIQAHWSQRPKRFKEVGDKEVEVPWIVWALDKVWKANGIRGVFQLIQAENGKYVDPKEWDGVDMNTGAMLRHLGLLSPDEEVESITNTALNHRLRAMQKALDDAIKGKPKVLVEKLSLGAYLDNVIAAVERTEARGREAVSAVKYREQKQRKALIRREVELERQKEEEGEKFSSKAAKELDKVRRLLGHPTTVLPPDWGERFMSFVRTLNPFYLGRSGPTGIFGDTRAEHEKLTAWEPPKGRKAVLHLDERDVAHAFVHMLAYGPVPIDDAINEMPAHQVERLARGLGLPAERIGKSGWKEEMVDTLKATLEAFGEPFYSAEYFFNTFAKEYFLNGNSFERFNAMLERAPKSLLLKLEAFTRGTRAISKAAESSTKAKLLANIYADARISNMMVQAEELIARKEAPTGVRIDTRKLEQVGEAELDAWVTDLDELELHFRELLEFPGGNVTVASGQTVEALRQEVMTFRNQVEAKALPPLKRVNPVTGQEETVKVAEAQLVLNRLNKFQRNLTEAEDTFSRQQRTTEAIAKRTKEEKAAAATKKDKLTPPAIDALIQVSPEMSDKDIAKVKEWVNELVTKREPFLRKLFRSLYKHPSAREADSQAVVYTAEGTPTRPVGREGIISVAHLEHLLLGRKPSKATERHVKVGGLLSDLRNAIMDYDKSAKGKRGEKAEDKKKRLETRAKAKRQIQYLYPRVYEKIGELGIVVNKQGERLLSDKPFEKPTPEEKRAAKAFREAAEMAESGMADLRKKGEAKGKITRTMWPRRESVEESYTDPQGNVWFKDEEGNFTRKAPRTEEELKLDVKRAVSSERVRDREKGLKDQEKDYLTGRQQEEVSQPDPDVLYGARLREQIPPEGAYDAIMGAQVKWWNDKTQRWESGREATSDLTVTQQVGKLNQQAAPVGEDLANGTLIKGETTLTSLLDKIINSWRFDNLASHVRDLLRVANANGLDVKVRWVNSKESFIGRYKRRTSDPLMGREILLNRLAYNEYVRKHGAAAANAYLAHALNHEVAHAQTVFGLENDPQLRKELTELMEIAALHLGRDWAGLKDLDVAEFVAEVHTNSDFRYFLRRVPMPNNGNALRRFFEAVRRFFRRVIGKPVDNLLDYTLDKSSPLFMSEARMQALGSVPVSTEYFNLDVSIPDDVTTNAAEVAALGQASGIRYNLRALRDAVSRGMLGGLTLDQIGESFKDRWKSSLEQKLKDKDNPLMQFINSMQKKWALINERLHEANILIQKMAALPTVDREDLADIALNATRFKMHPDQPFQKEGNAHLSEDARKNYTLLRAKWDALKARNSAATDLYAELRAKLEKDFKDDIAARTFNVLNAMLDGIVDPKTGQQIVLPEKTFFSIMLNGATEEDPSGVRALLKHLGVDSKFTEKDIKELMRLTRRPKQFLGPYFPLRRTGRWMISVKTKRVFKFRDEAEMGEVLGELEAWDPGLKKEIPNKEDPLTMVITFRGYERFDSKRKADARRQELANEAIPAGVEGKPLTVAGKTLKWENISEVMEAENLVRAELQAGLDKQLFDRLQKKLANNPAAWAALKTSYLEQLPDTSPRKAELRRTNQLGFSSDLMQGLASYFRGSSYRIENMKHDSKIQELLNTLSKNAPDAEAQAAVKELTKRQKLSGRLFEETTFSRTMDRLTEIGFVWFLGSPSYWMINATQPAMITFPYLSARYGVAKTTRAMERAYRLVSPIVGSKMMRSGFGLKALSKKNRAKLLKEVFSGFEEIQDRVNKADPTLGKILKWMEERGLIEMTIAQDLREAASGFTTSGETLADKTGQAWDNVVEMTRIMPQLVEVLNRTVTAISAYELAKADGVKDFDVLLDTAMDAVKKTQFNYSAINKARWFSRSQNEMLRPIMMFKQYAQNMIYLMARSTIDGWLNSSKSAAEKKIARKTLGYVLGMHTLAGGVLGGIFVEPVRIALGLTAFLAQQAGLMDDDESLDTWVQNVLAEAFGEDLGKAVSKGVPYALGVDLHSRLGLNNLLFMPGPYQNADGGEYLKGMAWSMLGPLAATTENMVSIPGRLRRGDVNGAVRAFLPKGLRDVWKAVSYADNGVIDYNGNEIMDSKSFDPFSLAVQALGFQPSDVSHMYARRSAMVQAEQWIATERQNLLQRYRRAKPGDRSGVLKAINSFNIQNPEFRITGKNRVDALRNKREYERRARRTEGYGRRLKPSQQRKIEKYGEF